jgi:hypothetical protein
MIEILSSSPGNVRSNREIFMKSDKNIIQLEITPSVHFFYISYGQ